MIRIYKSGRVRLTGIHIEALRFECRTRDQMRCRECLKPVLVTTDWDGHPDRYHMAHIQSRGAGGSDTLENVRTLCGACHRASHGNPMPRNRTETGVGGDDGNPDT